MKTITLHIGTHKTGTTALQHYLHHNRLRLADAGWFYPKSGISASHFGHHDVAWHFSRKQPFDFTNLFLEIDSAQVGNILLSSEEFEFFKRPDEIKSRFSAYRVRIVLYLRRQDELLLSEFNQNVKMGLYGGTLNAFSAKLEKHGRFDYHALCDRWAKAFGRDNVIVRIFRPEVDILDDFPKLLGISCLDCEQPHNLHVNKSLDPRLIGTMRSLIQIRGDISDPELFGELLQITRKHPLLSPAGKVDRRHSLLGYKQRVDLLKRCMASNALLSENYLSGDTFEPPDPEARDVKISEDFIHPALFRRILKRMAQ